MQNNLTSPSLTFKAWYSQLKDEVRSHTDVFTRNYIRRSVKGGRVSANINKFESSEYKRYNRHIEVTFENRRK